jgi:hypothetical protein
MAAIRSEKVGWYTADCDKIQFTLPERYQNLTPIGRGAFHAVM